MSLTEYFIDFQIRSIRRFYSELRDYLDSISSEKYIPISTNDHFNNRTYNNKYRGYYYVDLIYYFIGEAGKNMQAASDYIHSCKLAEAFRMPQIMSTKLHFIAHSRAALATSYANGCLYRVPWDILYG